MTPESIKSLFDANAILIIFAWGLLCKFAPFLRAVPNNAIPWVGAIGYIVGKLAVGTVFAQDGTAAPVSTGNVVIAGFTSAIWARQLFEGFFRVLFDRLFKKAK